MAERKTAYTLEVADVVCALQSHARSPRLPAILIVLAAIAGALLLVSQYIGASIAAIAIAAGAAGGVLVGALLYWLYIPWRARRQYAQFKLLREPVELTWDEATVVMATPSAWSRIAWSDLRRWAEDHRVYRLYPTDMMFHIVPKRAFTTADDRAAFRRCLDAIGKPITPSAAPPGRAA